MLHRQDLIVTLLLEVQHMIIINVAPTGSDRHAAAGSERRVGYTVALCISAHLFAANGRVRTLVEAEVAAMAAK